MKFTTTLACAAALLTSAAFADGHGTWTSTEAAVAFGSIKKDTVGEIHHFTNVKGEVTEDGQLTITIDLASAETNIDIRNERMQEHVFAGMPNAVFSGSVDMSEVENLAVGETTLAYVEGDLSLGPVDAFVDTDMLVARLAEDKVLVTTSDFIIVSTADLGIDAGVDKLMELANLPGITRVTPVSIRMILEK